MRGAESERDIGPELIVLFDEEIEIQFPLHLATEEVGDLANLDVQRNGCLIFLPVVGQFRSRGDDPAASYE